MPTDDVVTLGQRVSQLERRNRWLSLSLFGVVFALLLGAYGLVRTGLQASKTNDTAARVEKFAEITVGRINIAGPNGVNRIILAHEMPQAPFQGEMIERTVPPGLAGMIYCAPNGDEVGGIGVSGSEKGGHSLGWRLPKYSP